MSLGQGRRLPRVADFGIKIVLLEMQPGSEHDFIAETNGRLSALGISPGLFYRALGKYDLMLVERSDLSETLLKMGAVRGVLSSTELVCFPWELPGSPLTPAALLSAINTPVLGICILKLDPQALAHDGVRVEQGLAENLLATQETEAFYPLGTLGWAEMVVLVPRARVGQTFNDLARLASRMSGVDPERETVLKSFSLLAVADRIYTDPLSSESEPFSYSQNDPSPVLSLACEPGQMGTFAHELNSWYEPRKATSCLGRSDIRLHVHEGEWFGFLRRVQTLRESQNEGLFSTAVSPVGASTPEPRLARSRPLPAIVELHPLDVQAITRQDNLGYVGSAVVHLVYSFNSFAQNPLFSETYSDMRGFMQKLVRMCKDEELRAHEWPMDRLTHLAWFGIQERLKGAYLAVEDSEPAYPPYRGGLQRAIVALESMIRSNLLLSGEEWNGFVTVGHEGEFRHLNEVINLPMDEALRPERWWPVSHEMCHVLVLSKDIVGGNYAVLQQRLPYFLPASQAESHRFKRSLREIETDILDFCCFFGSDWTSYRAKVLGFYQHYFNRQSIDNVDRQIHLVRLLCVLIYSKRYVTGELQGAVSDETARRLASELLQGYEQTYFKDVHEQPAAYVNLVNEGLEIFLRVQNFVAQVHDEMALQPWFIRYCERRASPEIENQLDRLAEGEPVVLRGSDHWPLLLKRALRSADEASFRERIATILSVWDDGVARDTPSGD
jgi:hypothetical protein